jgi:dTDP-4-amino-4,6-dideoxy-D-glucose acyltransferase
LSDFLSPDEITHIGFAHVGNNVLISRHALFFAADHISIADNVRIDAYCLFSGGEGIRIGRNVHVSAFTAILGRSSLEIGNFATVSARCTIFTSSDDYTGATMTNPTIPADYRGANHAPVRIGDHVIIGAGSTILPGVEVGNSAGIGAASLVKGNVTAFDLVAGVPARVIGRRVDGHLRLADQLLAVKRREVPNFGRQRT